MTDLVLPTTITTSDGYVVDVDTGEVLGIVEAPFAVTDAQSAEWVLERMMDVDADLLAENARLAAKTEHIRERIAKLEKRKEWLQLRFGPELETFARPLVGSVKDRTLVLDNGSISFRKSPGSIKITDMEAAVKWAKRKAKDAVKVVTTVLVGSLKGRTDLPVSAFEVTEPYDKCTIETGIAKVKTITE